MAAKVNELQEALTILEKDKGIRKEYILDALETALMHSYRKNYKDDSENVEIKINDLNGDGARYFQKDSGGWFRP